MKVMIKMPTKGRKEKFFSTLDIFYDLCENTKMTYFLILVFNRQTLLLKDQINCRQSLMQDEMNVFLSMKIDLSVLKMQPCFYNC